MIHQKLSLTFLMALILVILSAAQGPTAEVLVTVDVRDPDGQPIAEAPVQVYSDAGLAFGFTDETGEVSLTIKIGPDNPEIIARLWNGSFQFPELSFAQLELAESRFKELLGTYFFTPRSFAQTSPGQTRYQIDIVGQAAVQATGRLVDAQGQPIEQFFHLWVRDGYWHSATWGNEFTPGDGTFTVRAIPRGMAAELWIGLSTPETQIVELSASQTIQNFDLGDIVATLHDRPIPLEMTVTNATALYDRGDVPLWTQVSLIRDDAQVLLTFPVKPPDGEVVAKVVQVQTDVPRTTAGVYYIVPGGINTPTALALLDALRANQHAQLDAAGAAKFVATEGQTTQFTLDARQAREAIRTATKQ